MSWIQDIQWFLTKRKLAKLNRDRQHIRDFVDIEQAQKVGLVVNMNLFDLEETNTLRKYIEGLKKRNKRVFLVEINFIRKSEPQFKQSVESVFVSPKEMNLLKFPKTAVEKQIRRHELDILINFDTSEHPTSKYVCSVASAKTRTGRYEEGFENCYELMVHMSAKTTFKQMLKEFDYFLQMIEK